MRPIKRKSDRRIKDSMLRGQTMTYEYYRFDSRFNSKTPITEKQFNRKIRSKYIFPIWDDYYQEFDYDSYYDIRDSIVRIFYFKVEVKDD